MEPQPDPSLLEAIHQNWVTVSIAVLGIVGSVASVTSLAYGFVIRKKNERLLRFVDLNVDKAITKETIKKKHEEVSLIDRRIADLKRQVRHDIPVAARRAVLQDRLNAVSEELTKTHQSVINIKRELLQLGDRSDLADDILRAVRHEIQPSFLVKERISRLETLLTVLTTVAALAAVVLPHYIGRMLASALVLIAIPIGIGMLLLSKRIKRVRTVNQEQARPEQPEEVGVVTIIKTLPKEQADAEVDSFIVCRQCLRAFGIG